MFFAKKVHHEIWYTVSMSDKKTVKNQFGEITITTESIAVMLLDTLRKFSTRVFLSNKKGRLLRVKGRFENAGTDDVEVAFDDHTGRVRIRIYVIISFGISINETVNRLIYVIAENTEKMLGEKPGRVAVCVKGVRSQRKTAKRNIEFSKAFTEDQGEDHTLFVKDKQEKLPKGMHVLVDMTKQEDKPEQMKKVIEELNEKYGKAGRSGRR